MRGKLWGKTGLTKGERITPAYAGKTSRDFLSLCGIEDHPRVCGENHVCGRKLECKRGSPPRMRGKHTPLDWKNARKRITPAYAGKTKPVASDTAVLEDHPRVCGENSGLESVIHRYTGSPPRMRGKRFSASSWCMPVRITPAYAGKTLSMIDLQKT